MTEPLSVLFLCTANICRSPAMEIIARDLAGDADVVFSSSGTHAHTGHRMNPVQAATIPHLDVSGFRSRRLKPEMVDEADLVLTAESIHRQHVLDDYAHHHRKIFTLGQFEAAIEEIPDLSGRELVTAVGQKRQPAHPELDVADPYRRGEKAAATATARITEMLRVVIPRLTGDS
ncbi:hypothetical protein L2K70_01350 [Nocardioides KLBMP 9356]|uniref:Phosphotyrosine protein phosphatase I domain-containing protein n=1 Tax=Nocardioides potassii TaxID=2911371 RepID=A0ABS9H7I5_9ACTN|nr:hypothetical protein [Nocardioides potassii]MCF6376242.1 hypothetical protein [Nocardioides potassii]